MASGRPSGVTTKAMTTCTQSPRLSSRSCGITEAARAGLVWRHVALEIGRGQIVEQDFVTCAQQVGPAFAQVAESRFAGLLTEQQVVVAVERAVLRGAFVHAEQVARGCS